MSDKNSNDDFLNRINSLETENKILREKLSEYENNAQIRLNAELKRKEIIETNLINSELNLINLIEAIPLPVFFKTKSGVYIGCNEEFAKFENVPKEKIIGSSLFDIFSEQKIKEYREHDFQVINEKKTIVRQKTVTVNSSKHHIEIHKSIFTDIRNNEPAIVGVIIYNT